MSDESWDNPETSANNAPREASMRLGFGRGRVNVSAPEVPQPTKWNSGGGGSGFSSGFSKDESNNNGGSKYRDYRDQHGDNSNSSNHVFRTNQNSNSRSCYNCNKSGHISRECPEPRKERDMKSSGFDSNSNRNRGFQSSGSYNEDRGFQSNFRSSGDASGRDNQNSTSGMRPRNNGFSSGNNNNYDDRQDFNSNNQGFRSQHGDRDSNRSGFVSRDVQSNNTMEFRRRPPGAQGGRDPHVSDDIFEKGEGNGPGGKRVEHYIPPTAPKTEAELFDTATKIGQNFSKYQHTKVQCTPEGSIKPIEMYEEANLDPTVLTNIRRSNYNEPTSIQQYAIPIIQEKHDLMACAQTGSGKTAAFLLPIISNILADHSFEEKSDIPSPICLILSPTRELALQTEKESRKFSFQTPIVTASAIGGRDMYTTSDQLRGCHILSATTGRLIDMVQRGRVSLKNVTYLVLDEADRMLDQGFEPDIRKLDTLGILSKDKRHTLMFSATFPEGVQRLARNFLRHDYIFLTVGTIGGANEDISQSIEEVRAGEKKNRLVQLLDENLKDQRCLIFVETKRSADYLGALLSQKGLKSTTMHGDRTQEQRELAVRQFKKADCPILVATSVAARGLDFPLIGYVVNYDLPDTSDFYIHRIGRTGRAGNLGKSISFFDPDRDSDRRLAPELAAKLIEAGQPVPDFLKKFDSGSGNIGPGNSFGSSDVRFRSNDSQRQNFGASSGGGSMGAGKATAEDWD